jgi:protein-S-isoprenylcysteine O-methyltransferase Ste14
MTLMVAIWFHRRVLADEKNLARVLGAPYIAYAQRVKRWIPGLF